MRHRLLHALLALLPLVIAAAPARLPFSLPAALLLPATGLLLLGLVRGERSLSSRLLSLVGGHRRLLLLLLLTSIRSSKHLGLLSPLFFRLRRDR